MDFNLEYKKIETNDVTEKEVFNSINKFLGENKDLDGIYKIQSEEFLSYLSRKLSILKNSEENNGEDKEIEL